MMNDDIAIKVENVSKTFRLPHEKNASVKGAFIHFYNRNRTYEKQEALRDVSFEVKKGEFFGIVGRNGSGKSTLLKMLAGIYNPSVGAIRVNGKLTPFIELGVGFNPELTGRENVYLNGALLGFSRKEMNRMYKDIVEFAELHKFMDQKLKNYSSGMQVRLAFSIAIRAKSDILLLDEVLAVGDENFQRKCYSYFGQLKKEGRTVILVSHDMGVVRDYCTNGLLLDDGQIVKQDDVGKIAQEYTNLNIKHLEASTAGSSGHSLRPTDDTTARIEKVWTTLGGKDKKVFKPNEKIEVNLEINPRKKLKDPVVGLIFQDQQGRVVFATNTNEMSIKLGEIKGRKKIHAKFAIDNIYTNGTYSISCAFTDATRSDIYSRIEEAAEFSVAGWPMGHSLAHPEHHFELI